MSDDKAGSKGKCPNCGQVVQVPQAAGASAMPRSAAAPIPRTPHAPPAAYPGIAPAAPQRPPPRMPPASAPRHSLAANYPVPAGMEPPAEPVAAEEVAAADGDTIPGFGDAYATQTADDAAAALGGYAPQPAYYTPPVTRHPRGAKQRRNLHSATLFTFLGIALLIGFVLPIVGPGKTLEDIESGKPNWYNINFRAIGMADAPMALRLFCLAPALAGIAVLIVGRTTRGVTRGAIVGAIGLVAFSIPFIDQAARGLFDVSSRSSDSSGMISAGTMVVGVLIMFAGIFGLRHRPEYRPLSILAIVGGAMFIISLFIPSGADGKMPIASIFSSASSSTNSTSSSYYRAPEPDPMIGVSGIASTLAGIATAGYCIIVGSMNRWNRKLAKISLWMAIGASALLFISMVLAFNLVMSMILAEGHGSRFVASFIMSLKITAWLGTLALLISFGLSELMLGLAEQQSGEAGGSGFAVQMNQPPQGYPPAQGYQQPGYPQQPTQPY